jgi:methyl-accepting chemotaxis protein
MFKKRLDIKITAVVVGIFTLGFALAISVNLKEISRNLLELNKEKVRAVTFMITKSVQHIMLLGDGYAAGDLIADMQSIHDIEEISIMRTNGMEAFKDLETINKVNKVLGGESFKREPKIANLLMNPDNKYFRQALDTMQTVEYYEKRGELELFTQLTSLNNRVECQGCHGTESAIRGILKITTRMEGIQSKIAQSRNHLIEYAIAILLLIFVFLKFALNHTVIKPIQEISSAVKSVADGDISKLYQGESQDEIGQLGFTLNEMTLNLRKVAQRLMDLTKHLSISSYQIFSSSQDIASGADNQASLVLKASSAIEEMSSSIQSIVSTVNDAAKSAEAATHLASKGAEGVWQTSKEIMEANDLIKELNEQAKGVKKISQVIQEISAQTNILSLNAAIEASRAGEHGKGFTVISNEIRALANKTSQSAVEISEIIDSLQWRLLESTQIISGNLKLVNQAGESLRDIVEGITSTNDMVKTIASFTNQQAKTAKEISESLHDISKISQHTAAGAKEAVESNKGISDISSQLQEISQSFKT